MLTVGNYISFQYGNSEEVRHGTIEKVTATGTITLQDHARKGDYRSFKVAKIRNARLVSR